MRLGATGHGRPCEWRARHVLMPGALGAGTSMLACRLTVILLSITLPARRSHLSVDKSSRIRVV
jgi:hypothetical protein